MRSGQRAERPDSLLHPTYGYCAADVRSAVGAAPRARLARLESLVAAARRHEALHHKHPRGMSLGVSRAPVRFDPNGQIQGRSLKPTVLLLEPDPNDNPFGFIVDLDIDELIPLLDIPAGCDCCPADITFNFVDVGTCHCLTFGTPVYNAETCTWAFPYTLDCGCINGHIGPG